MLFGAGAQLVTPGAFSTLLFASEPPYSSRLPAGGFAVNEPGVLTGSDRQLSRPVFVSYATADRKEALAVCKAIERRGTKCWISCRDVAPGENYQEAIVRTIRSSRAMVLVFSDAANNSDEIKKELSLASKNHIPLLALRIEDVEPNDAFAYELSTRQWIDAFESWDKSIDSLVRHIKQMSAAPVEETPSATVSAPRRRASMDGNFRLFAIASLVALALLIAGAAWWFLRPTTAAPHSMMVRLTGFQNLSSDIPANMPAAMRDEIVTAFNDDGVVGVSTATAPPAGDAPAYALGGTIRRDGDQIKVNVSLTNERSGATLWSNIFSYDADQQARVPRHIAVDAGNMLRCGLFAASTYRKALPDPILTDYMSMCQNSGYVDDEPGKALDLAKKIVAAAPDFSWGWSGVAGAAIGMSFLDPLSATGEDYRKQAGEAADKAIALDKSNSEAIDTKAFVLPPNDFIGREALFKQALSARPLACGCEHHLYGGFLQSVGRNREAVDEYRRSTDVMALDFDSQLGLGDALLMTGRPDDAKQHFANAADLSSDPAVNDLITIQEVSVTKDYAAALKAIQNPKLKMPQAVKDALTAAYQALVSGDAGAKARAVQQLSSLPPERKGRGVASVLAALGANREALEVVETRVRAHGLWGSSWLFLPMTRGLLDDPTFPAFAQKLGLMNYWKTTHTKPDVCSEASAPAFCRMI
jgi:tetratricopeptide (TPR) repeat protein